MRQILETPSDGIHASIATNEPLESGGVIRLCVITPAKNEREGLESLFESLSTQTVRPHLWLIVDDNSKDGSIEKAVELSRYDWVRVLSAQVAPGKIDRSFKVFRFGTSHLPGTFEAIAKVDADTILPSNFVEVMLENFRKNRRLGIASGVNRHEWTMAHHLRGNSRAYRWDCWRELRIPDDGIGWDTIDAIEARAQGWEARTFPELVCNHLRSRKRDINYHIQMGRISRYLGYYYWYAAARAGLTFGTGGLAQAAAFLTGFLLGGYGTASSEVVSAIRSDQIGRMHILFRKVAGQA